MPRSMLPNTERFAPWRMGVTSTWMRSSSVSTDPPALQADDKAFYLRFRAVGFDLAGPLLVKLKSIYSIGTTVGLHVFRQIH